MKSTIKKILITTFTFFLIIFFISSNYDKLIYLNDSIKSFFITGFQDNYGQSNDFAIINPDRFKNYVKLYSKTPPGFVHNGFLMYYKADNKIKLKAIAAKSIKYTNFYKIEKFLKAITIFNGIAGDTIKKDEIVFIPGILPPLIPDTRNRKKPELIFTKGIYLTGTSTGREDIFQKIERFKRLGINTLVFDAKDVTGIVNYNSEVKDVIKYNTHAKRPIDNIDKLIRELKQRKIHSIARISVFQDRLLYKKNRSLAIRSKRTGKGWRTGRELWCDPTNKTVQDYNIAIAVELAEKGVDEIQFDYIRFPTTGNLKDAKYTNSFGRMKKEETIAHFLKRAYKEISARNTLLSIDIFGVVAWSKDIDIEKTGQKIEFLYQYCDIISPMLYPSHFDFNFDGRDNPADHPYYFIFTGSKKVISLSKGKTAVRPWLQAFKWRVTDYNAEYIIKQIKAAKDSGSNGYLFWNSSNNYDTVFKALEILSEKS